MESSVYGLYGIKNKYISNLNFVGVNRPSSAWFMFNTARDIRSNELRISVFLSIYFAISISTLRNVENANMSLLEWYIQNPTSFPTIVAFPYNQVSLKDMYYISYYPGYAGMSFPYTRVEESGSVRPPLQGIEICPEIVEIEGIISKHSNSNTNKTNRFFRKFNSEFRNDLGIAIKTEWKAADFSAALEPHYSKLLINSIT
ncbi:hypothetical protein D3C75_270410 [compost metagenome]